MTLREAVDLVTGWLDCVHIESAPARVAEEIDSLHEPEVERLHGTVTQRGDRGRVSLHEAAHAIVGYAWGSQVVRVRVLTDLKGAVESNPATPLGRAVELLAGPFTELIAGSDTSRRFQLSHGSDILDAAVEISRMSQMSNRAVASVAASTVWEHWDQINRIAVVLNEFGELDGASIAALCGAAN